MITHYLDTQESNKSSMAGQRHSTSFTRSLWALRSRRSIYGTQSESRSGEGRECLLQSHPPFTLMKVYCTIFGKTFDTLYNKSKRPGSFHNVIRSMDLLGFPRRTAPSVHFCLHMIQNISQSVLYHSTPAHVTHRVVSDVLWRVFEGRSKVNGNRAALVQ